MEEKYPVKYNVGIIPLADPKKLFNVPWHDCLMPLNDRHLAIDHAVFNCALAGCDTIWIVGHIELQPLVRKHVGEMIIDPLSVKSTPQLNFYRHDKMVTKREVPIFYIPIHPSDRKRRDSLAYSAVYGAISVMKTTYQISRWLMPGKFFISFPYGIVPQESIYEIRKYSRKWNSAFVSYQGKTVKDNLLLPFSMCTKDIRMAKFLIKNYGKGLVSAEDEKLRVSKFFFTPQELFASIDMSKSNVVETPWYHQIDNWDNYSSFLASEHSKNLYDYDEFVTYENKIPLNFEGTP